MSESKTEALLHDLNDAQKDAVQIARGPALVIAGPGSGKTRVITHRAAYLIELAVEPRNILTLTFSNKAARELRERLAILTGKEPASTEPTITEGVTASTFHAYCAGILRRFGDQLGLSTNYSIFDQDDQRAAIKRCITDAGYDPARYTPRDVEQTIERAKNNLLTPEDLIRDAKDHLQEGTARIYRAYEETLARNNAVDYSGLLFQACRLLAENPSILTDCQERHQHLMLDEFQDTNTAQYRLATLLAERYRNIMAVGDPDQSIYSWRSAGPANIRQFLRDYPEARTVRLKQNYRSTPNILEAAQELMSQDALKPDGNESATPEATTREPDGENRKLVTNKKPGKPVRKFRANNPEHEARAIIREVQRLQKEEQVNPGDCAVLLRVNAQSRALEEACNRYEQSYRITSGARFYQRQEIRDITAYLRVLHNGWDDLNLQRIINSPPRGIGEKSISRIMDLARRMETSGTGALRAVAEAQRQGYLCPSRLKPKAAASAADLHDLLKKLSRMAREQPVSQTVRAAVKETGLDKTGNPDDLEEFVRIAAAFDEEKPAAGLTALLERATLMSQLDETEPSQDAVNILTLHQAKGLEFEAVFIPGMEEGLIPHHRSMKDPEQLQEERRLCYVGVTRAMSRLYLTWSAERRNVTGQMLSARPSRFLDQIPDSGPRGQDSPNRKMQPGNTPRKGERVIHPQLGTGTVVGTEQSAEWVTIVVKFQKSGTHRLDLFQPPEEGQEKGQKQRAEAGTGSP